MSERYYRHEVEQVAALLQAGKHTNEIARDLSGPLGRSYEGIQCLAQRLARGEVKLSLYAERPNFTEIAPSAPNLSSGALPLVSRHTSPVASAVPPKQRPTHGREIALFDIHHPHNIPLDAIWCFCEDFEPDVLILGGDAIDAGPFSHFNIGKLGLLKTLPDPIDMFAKFIEDILKPSRRAVGDKCYIVYLLGNHEDWIRQAIEIDPKGKGYWEVENNLGRIPDEVIPYVNDQRFNMFNLGKLHFIHGTNCRKYEAQFVVSDYDVPIRFGHTHTFQAHTKKRGANVKDFRIAVNCGCLYDFSGGLPTYVKNRSAAWINAIQYGIVKEDGSFHDDVPVIVGGRFMAAGKVYQS